MIDYEHPYCHSILLLLHNPHDCWSLLATITKISPYQPMVGQQIWWMLLMDEHHWWLTNNMGLVLGCAFPLSKWLLAMVVSQYPELHIQMMFGHHQRINPLPCNAPRPSLTDVSQVFPAVSVCDGAGIQRTTTFHSNVVRWVPTIPTLRMKNPTVAYSCITLVILLVIYGLIIDLLDIQVISRLHCSSRISPTVDQMADCWELETHRWHWKTFGQQQVRDVPIEANICEDCSHWLISFRGV